MTALFSTGYIPDPVGHQRTSFDHYKRLLSSAPIPLASDTARFSPVGPSGRPQHFNQGQTGSCVGHASSGAIYAAFAAAGRALGFIPSMKFIYALARMLDRLRNPDGSFPALADIGCQPNQMVRAVSTFGIVPLVTLTDRFSDCDPETINDEVLLDEVEQSLMTLVIGEYAIFSSGKQRSDDVAQACSSGLGITAAINGGCRAFQEYTGGVLTANALAGDLDHDVRIAGHRTVSNAREFKIFNSWDESWGEGGDAWIDESALDTLGDIYIITPNRG